MEDFSMTPIKIAMFPNINATDSNCLKIWLKWKHVDTPHTEKRLLRLISYNDIAQRYYYCTNDITHYYYTMMLHKDITQYYHTMILHNDVTTVQIILDNNTTKCKK